MNLEDYDSVKRWFTKLKRGSGSPRTRRAYLTSLRQFCRFVGKTPDELIEERRAELESKDEFIRRHAEEMLDKWFEHLSETKSPRTGELLKRNTCVQRFYAVCSFYEHNYLELKVNSVSSWPSKQKPTLTREDLGRILEAASLPMHKAYVLCQAQSGLGVSDLLAVPLDTVRKQIADGQDYVHLRLLRGKRKELGWFDTFFGRMAVSAITVYLEEEKPKGTLFPCTDRNVRKFVAHTGFKVGLDWRVGTHNLRKFFSNQLKTTRLNDPAFNDSLIEYWMGHSLGRVKGAYTAPPIEEQVRLYKQAEKRLEPIS